MTIVLPQNSGMRTYGTCPACGQRLRLLSRGRICGHSAPTDRGLKTCKGSGAEPAEAEEQAALTEDTGQK